MLEVLSDYSSKIRRSKILNERKESSTLKSEKGEGNDGKGTFEH